MHTSASLQLNGLPYLKRDMDIDSPIVPVVVPLPNLKEALSTLPGMAPSAEAHSVVESLPKLSIPSVFTMPVADAETSASEPITPSFGVRRLVNSAESSSQTCVQHSPIWHSEKLDNHDMDSGCEASASHCESTAICNKNEVLESSASTHGTSTPITNSEQTPKLPSSGLIIYAVAVAYPSYIYNDPEPYQAYRRHVESQGEFMQGEDISALEALLSMRLGPSNHSSQDSPTTEMSDRLELSDQYEHSAALDELAAVAMSLGSPSMASDCGVVKSRNTKKQKQLLMEIQVLRNECYEKDKVLDQTRMQARQMERERDCWKQQCDALDTIVKLIKTERDDLREAIQRFNEKATEFMDSEQQSGQDCQISTKTFAEIVKGYQTQVDNLSELALECVNDACCARTESEQLRSRVQFMETEEAHNRLESLKVTDFVAELEKLGRVREEISDECQKVVEECRRETEFSLMNVMTLIKQLAGVADDTMKSHSKCKKYKNQNKARRVGEYDDEYVELKKISDRLQGDLRMATSRAEEQYRLYIAHEQASIRREKMLESQIAVLRDSLDGLTERTRGNVVDRVMDVCESTSTESTTPEENAISAQVDNSEVQIGTKRSASAALGILDVPSATRRRVEITSWDSDDDM